MPIGGACQQLAFTVSDVRRSQRTTRNTSIKSRDAQDPVPILVTGHVPRQPPGRELPDGQPVQAFDPPHAISWEPGQVTGDGDLRFGGWVWRYELAPAGPPGPRSPCPTTGRRSPPSSASTSDSPHSLRIIWQLADPPRRLGHRVTGQQARPAPDLPSGLARPARQALAAAGYATLEQLTQVIEDDLAQLHGIGPKAIAQLRDALAAAGLSFATEN